MSTCRSSAAPALLAVCVALATAACMPRSQHDDDLAGEAQTTAAEIPGWTKVVVAPRPESDVLRPTREERVDGATELVASQLTEQAVPVPAARPRARRAERPLPDWVPASGCLTIVGASDLARNLGMVDELDDAPASVQK